MTREDITGENRERSSILSNFGHLMSSQMATWMLSTIVAVVVPRYIGPTGQGQLRLAMSLWAIGQVVAAMGTNMFLTLTVARDRTHGLELVGPVMLIRAFAFVATSLPLLAYAWVTNADATLFAIIAILGLSALLDLTTAALSSAMQGLEQMAGPARALVVAKLVWSAGVCGVVLAGGGVREIVAVTVLGSALNLVLITRVHRKVANIVFAGWRRHARAIVVGSAGFFAAGAILTIYQQIDTVVIAVLVDEETLGWYATADALFGSLLFLPTVTVMALYPVLGRLYADDRVELDRLVERAITTLIVAAVPIGVGTSLVGPNLAPLVYGEQFRETGDVLVAIGPVIIFVFGTTLIGAVAMATDRQKFWNYLMLVGVVLTIPLDLVLVPWTERRFENGAIGGALAYVVTEFLMLVVGLVVVAPTLLNRRVGDRVFRVLVAGGVLFAATWPVRDAFILVPIAVGAAVYIAMVMVLRIFGRPEIDTLRRMIRPESPAQHGPSRDEP